MTIKELREKRAQLAAEVKRMSGLLTGDKTAFTAEEQAQWERVNAEYDSNAAALKIAERAEQVESESRSREDRRTLPGRDDMGADDARSSSRGNTGGNAAAATEEDRSIAIQAWFREQCGHDLEERHVEACERLGFNPRRRNLDIELLSTTRHQALTAAFRNGHQSGAHKRALSANLGSTGGVTVAPGTLVTSLEVAMLDFSGVMQVADTIRTPSGEPLTWPTANDTSNSGRQIGESAAVTTLDPTFAGVTWSAYKFTSDEILVPTELLEDSVFDIAGVIGPMLGERLGRILESKFTTGTGAATPKGIVTAATLGHTTASATAITYDEIIRLEHSVDPAYRNAAGYMMHDSVMLALRLLKDGNGQYLWRSGVDSDRPDTLNGRPVTVNQNMASTIESGAKTVLFGQLNKYKVRMVNAIRLYRLVERHRENDQDAFLAFVRADGNLLDAGVAPVKYLLQA